MFHFWYVFFLLALMGQIIRANNIVFSQQPAYMDPLLSVCLIVIVLFLMISFLVIAGRNVYKILQHGQLKRRQKKLREVQEAEKKANEPEPIVESTITVPKPAPLVL